MRLERVTKDLTQVRFGDVTVTVANVGDVREDIGSLVQADA